MPIKSEESNDDFQVEEELVEEAVMQYLSGIFIPQPPPKQDPSLPAVQLEPIFINGFAGLESTQNVFFLNEHMILFAAATVGVVMDVATFSQKFFGATQEIDNSNAAYERYHKTSIVSICYNRDSKLVATGSLGGSPEICIWKADTLEPVSKFYQSRGTKAVSIVKFIGKDLVITVDRKSTKSNSLNIWSLDGKKKASSSCPGSVYSLSVDGLSGRIAIASSKGAYLTEYSDGS